MGINDTKRENLGVHGVQNVLLWYCQEIRGKALMKCLPFYYVWR